MENKNKEKNLDFDINVDSVFSLEIPEDGGLVVYIPTRYFNDKYLEMHHQLKNKLHTALRRLKRPYAPVIILPNEFKLELIDKGQYEVVKKTNYFFRAVLLSLFNIVTTLLIVKVLYDL